jgi:PPOX class probable F420-dependent enzyme
VPVAIKHKNRRGGNMPATSVVASDAMKKLTATQKNFLANPFVGALTTIRPDGSPHTTVVWVDYDDENALFNTARGRFKERNLTRDPRASLIVVDPENAYRWLSVSGSAELTEDGADAHIDRLAKKYLGEDTYPWRKPTETRVTVRIGPEKVDSAGLDGE